jgi:S1-C subfamily serine protease
VRRRGARAGRAAAAALVALLAGCGGGGGAPHSVSATSSSGASAPITIVQSADHAPFDAPSIFRRDSPGVVEVISTFPGGGSSVPGLGSGTAAQGSGFVISTDGEIVTNAHVVTNTTSGSGSQLASAVYVRFADDNEVPAKIVGTDPNADVALLRVNPSGLTLRPLALGVSSGLVVGSPVATLGTPLGEQNSLSVGVISATNRAIPSLNGSAGSGQGIFATLGAIQTDAAINHGNSGGPLVDAGGGVIGINSQIAPDSSGGATGIGFAVPVDAVRRSVARLRSSGTVKYAYMGISSEDLFPQLARRLGVPVNHGSIVGSVAPGSPAARAGLIGGTRRIAFDVQQYMVGGDVVSKFNGRPLTNDYNLVTAVTDANPGESVTLEVWRGKSKREVHVTLGTRPSGG